MEQITGVVQRETIPDEVVRRADQLQLVDLAVETIRARLARGDIYPAERVDAALGNYFRAGNLAALRELALLWIADRVEEGLAEYRARHGISETWETRERVLVALTGSPDGDRLVRRAARMAQRLNADLIAVHVRPQTGLATPSAGLLEQQGRLVERLGRELPRGRRRRRRRGSGRDGSRSQRHADRPRRQGALGLERVRLTARSSARSSGSRASASTSTSSAARPTPRRTWRSEPQAAPATRAAAPARGARASPSGSLGAPLLTLALTQARDQVSPSSALLLFLLLVVGVSAVGGLWPALVAAVGGFLLVNWYLTPPLHTFTIGDPENVLALLVFLAVAVAMSSFVALAARRAAQATRARAKAETLMRLAGTSSAAAILDGLRRAFGLDGAALLHRADDGWQVEAASGSAPKSPDDAGVVVEVDAEHVLVATSQAPRSSEDERMLDAFAKELAASVEHGELEAEVATAEGFAAVNELRASLLSSVSHDLRTPARGDQGVGDQSAPGRRRLDPGGASASC